MATKALTPAPQALGYVGVRAKDLGDWTSYGSGLLGLQRIDKSRSSLAFRMDDRKQRLIVDEDGGEGIAFFGWEVADAAALDAASGPSGSAWRQRGARLAGARGRAPCRGSDRLHRPARQPAGVFHGAEIATAPFGPGRNISGFRTGPLGLGHVVLNVERIDEMMPFYRDMLGFRLSDYFLRPLRRSISSTSTRAITASPFRRPARTRSTT